MHFGPGWVRYVYGTRASCRKIKPAFNQGLVYVYGGMVYGTECGNRSTQARFGAWPPGCWQAACRLWGACGYGQQLALGVWVANEFGVALQYGAYPARLLLPYLPEPCGERCIVGDVVLSSILFVRAGKSVESWRLSEIKRDDYSPPVL